MDLKVETITPEMAAMYLKKNTQNYRKLSMSKARQYAEDIISGRWQLNGEPLIFGEDGILKDGQHRLAAIVKAGKPVKMAVIRGVESEAYIYDVGMNRTAQQITESNGYEANSTIIGAVSILLNPIQYTPKTLIVEYTEKHFLELQRAFRTVNGNPFCKKSACMLASYLMLRTGTMPFYELEVFFRAFSTHCSVGLDGYDPSPAFTARKMFDDKRFNGRSGRSVQREQLEILMMALKDFHGKKARTESYKIQQPFQYEAYLMKVRKEDGIE